MGGGERKLRYGRLEDGEALGDGEGEALGDGEEEEEQEIEDGE